MDGHGFFFADGNAVFFDEEMISNVCPMVRSQIAA